MRTKAAQGLWPSYAPLGYQNTFRADQRRIITPHPVLGPIVTQAFDWFATGEYSLKSLAERAFEEGFRFRYSQAKVPVSTLHKMLRNPIYMGEFDFGGTRYRGTHEPLVTAATWSRVQEILDRRGTMKHRRTTHDFAYSGLVRCGHCGCSMVGEVKKAKYVYYHCTGYRGKCGEPYTPETVLRQEFANLLQSLVIPPATLRWLDTELSSCDDAEGATLAHSITRYRAELDRCRLRLDLIYEDRLDGRIDIETYDRKAQEVRQQQAQLQQKVNEFEFLARQPAAEELDAASLLALAGPIFLGQTAREQRRLLHSLMQEASWKGGALQITLREPFCGCARPKPPSSQSKL